MVVRNLMMLVMVWILRLKMWEGIVRRGRCSSEGGSCGRYQWRGFSIVCYVRGGYRGDDGGVVISSECTSPGCTVRYRRVVVRLMVMMIISMISPPTR